MFERYLREVYFSAFDPKDTSIDVSRNRVGHGVAAPSSFSARAAAIGVLVVNQLFHCFEPPGKNVGDAERATETAPSGG
jgi:hypothetical protein